MNVSIKRQRGMTLITLILLLGMIGIVTLLVLNIAPPIYIDHSKVTNSLKGLKEDRNVASMSKYDVLTSLEKRFSMNYVYDVKKEDIEIIKRGGYLKVAIQYEVVKPIVGNLSVLVEFDDMIEVGEVIKDPALLCKKLKLHFNNRQLLTTALTHRSMGANNNERLEFLGDSILGFVVAEKLHEMFPSASEGVLSRLRANLVNQSALADLARKHQLGDYLILGSGELKVAVFVATQYCLDAVEAIIGAIYKDQGFDFCRSWVLGMLKDKFDGLSLENWQKDPKTQLQELMQAQRAELPEYTLMTMSGLPHEQTFKVTCKINLLPETTTGTGVSRKKAEQDAAEQMLALLRHQ